MSSCIQRLASYSIHIVILIFFLMQTTACNPTPPTNVSGDNNEPTPKPTELTPQPQPTPSATVVAGTVSIWHAWDESKIPALATIIKAFQQVNPDVYFDVTYISENDLKNFFVTETANGDGPCLLLGPATWGEELHEAGVINDLSGMVETPLLNTINGAALKASYMEDKLIGLPYSLEGVVLYRNKDIATLNADSMQELVSLAQTSTQGEIVGAYLERSFYFSSAHLESLGGTLLDENQLPAFNSPEGLEWIELLQMFEQAGPTSFQTDEDLQAFRDGKVGWIIDGTWNLPSLVDALGPEKLAIDPWPTYGSGRLSGYISSENIYMNSQLDEQQKLASLKFMEFMLSSTAQALLGDIGQIPTASGVNLTNPVTGSLLMQAMSALANGTLYPQTPYLSVYEVQINIALQSIFQGSSPSAALQIAQDDIENELQQYKLTATPTP